VIFIPRSSIHSGPRIKRVPAKPKKRKKLVAVKVTKDGRWICNLKSAEGKRMYQAFIFDMWNKQAFACCLCRKPLSFEEATFEHTDLRGGGRRNDLPEYTKPNGQVIRNGVAHGICNSQKGSKRA
jgi:hypothetical protein